MSIQTLPEDFTGHNRSRRTAKVAARVGRDVFETDADRTYFVSRFPIHLKALQRLSKEELSEAQQNGTGTEPDGRLKLGTKLGIKLGINAEMILEAMIQDSHVTTKALSERLGISTTAIDKHIATLKEHGIITRKGSRKNGTWEV